MEFYEETERIRTELEVSRKKAEELLDEKREQSVVCSHNLEIMQLVKHGLLRLVENLDSHEKWGEYEEMREKEKRELEKSVVSLAEENRDIYSLLKIALVEKEATEKSLNRLRGNTEQKKATILQIAERGLQKVGFGFGFMMGSAKSETSADNLDLDTSVKSNNDEYQTVVVTLKKIMVESDEVKEAANQPAAATSPGSGGQSEMESLQHLSDKRSQKLEENMIYIKELEDRKMMLTQKVEELMVENKEAEEEICRWREACEMEVEAGTKAIKEQEELVNILNQELEKTRAALRTSKSKLQLKDELEATAIAAREAAERSLQLADSRATELHKQIEELTRQLEVAEKGANKSP
ncbi:hypothetical protein K7X08_035189 [Anisodus acutangulus]|uniref:Uncharacterized protein n=1 Tax=Anisodus acutangulus TaxID=402998 RepID=A0A9Q1LGX0_9SOLA|nr:hypothetical protein K7X08_035189 [Anisodus acutangulus]